MKGKLRLFAVLCIALAAPALGQEFPAKPVRIIVPSPGGTVDVVARLVAEKLGTKWGQAVLVENRAGAGGNIGADAVARSAPDGYTLLASPPGPLAINKSLYAKLTYDPDAFVPIAILATAPSVLVVNQKVPAQSLAQLLAFAKANPGKINYASAGSGSSLHLAAELFRSMAGINIVHVPYKGAGAALTDVIAGQVDMMFMDLGAVLPQVRAGKLRALAVASEKRNVQLPEAPTVHEFVPGFLSIFWAGLVAPAGTPGTAVSRIAAGTAEALKQPDVAKRLSELSLEAYEGSHDEVLVFLRQERERWSKVIRSAGITAD